MLYALPDYFCLITGSSLCVYVCFDLSQTHLFLLSFLRTSENWSEGKTMFLSANPGSTNSVTVPNLSPLSSYAFRIRAENDVGKSDYSREIAVTTTIEGM